MDHFIQLAASFQSITESPSILWVSPCDVTYCTSWVDEAMPNEFENLTHLGMHTWQVPKEGTNQKPLRSLAVGLVQMRTACHDYNVEIAIV